MAFTFKASGYSTAGLLMMYEGIRKAHDADVNTPEGSKKEYEVYENPDWKIQSDEIEQELRGRAVSFSPISWNQ